jgi:predicted GTPase
MAKFKNCPNDVFILDTPGLGDTEGRDMKHLAEMIEYLKEIKYVNAFFIVFNSE